MKRKVVLLAIALVFALTLIVPVLATTTNTPLDNGVVVAKVFNLNAKTVLADPPCPPNNPPGCG